MKAGQTLCAIGLAVAGCGTALGQETGSPSVRESASSQADAPATPRPGSFVRDDENDALSFHYSWPPEAEQIPALRAQFRAVMERASDRATRYARDGRRDATRDRRDFQPHYFSRNWHFGGGSRLLSFSGLEESFTGGAHGNRRFHALVWDREIGVAVAASDLLGAEAMETLTPRYCAALNAEREQRRGEPVPVPRDGNDDFNMCPPLAELVLSPVDDDGNGRFERIMVMIGPYIAGSYAEGDYVIDLPFEIGDVALMDARYREWLEPGMPLPVTR